MQQMGKNKRVFQSVGVLCVWGKSAENVLPSFGQVSLHIAPCGDRSICLKTIQLQHLLVWGLKASNKKGKKRHRAENPADPSGSLTEKHLQPPHYTFSSEATSNFFVCHTFGVVKLIFYVKSKLLISIFDLLIQFCINTHFVKSYSLTQPNVSPHDSTLYSEIFTDISQFPWVLGISINNHISIFFLNFYYGWRLL